MKHILLSTFVATALCGSVADVSAMQRSADTDIINAVSNKPQEADVNVEVNHFSYCVTSWWNDFKDWGISRGGKVAVLTGCTDEFYMPSHLVIPDEITVDGEKIPVVQVSFYEKTGLGKVTQLTLGKNVEVVGGFNGCQNLSTVNFNEGLKYIDFSTFNNSGLTAAIIPSTVRYIGRSAFANCKLKELQFVNSTVDDGYGLTIDEGAFYYCHTFESVTLPVQTEKVYPSSFGRNLTLREILVEKDCKNLRSDEGVLYQKSGDSYDAICYPGGKISESYAFPAFMNGGHIQRYFVDVNGSDFPSQKMLSHLDFSKLTSPIVIDSYAIQANAMTEIDLQHVDSVMADGLQIGAATVSVGKETRYIDPVALPGSVKSYTVDAANEYYKNDEAGSLLKVVEDGFELVRPARAWGLTTYTVPEGIVSLGDKSFWFCSKMTELTLSKELKRIGADAFYGDHALKKINVTGDAIDYIHQSALYGFNNYAWFKAQPDGGVYFAKVLYRWKGQLDEKSRVAVKDGTKVLSPYCFSRYVTPNSYDSQAQYDMSTVSLPSSLEKIYEYAFFCDEKLKSIVIPSGVTFIGSHAFCRSGLEKIDVPEGVTEIGESAFNGAPLTEVRIGNYVSDVPQTRIGKYAFSSLSKLEKLLIGGNVVEIGVSAFSSAASDVETPISVEIPSSVKVVDSWAFGSSNVDRLRIGANVEKIGSGAFNCKEEWIYDDNWNKIGAKCVLKEIHVEAMTPPAPLETYEDEAYVSFFTDAVYAQVPLYVPVGKVEAYRAAPGWKKFARILNEGDEDAIESVSAGGKPSVSAGAGRITVVAPSEMPVEVVSLSGAVLHSGNGSAAVTAVPGVYVVKVGKETVKLIVR